MTIPFELFLFLLLIATAVAVVRMQDLLAAAMLTGIFSLVSAGLFTLMDAVDVAFTEASVGAGISTILILSTLALTERRERQQRPRVLPFLVVGLTGLVLLYGTADMPAYGDPNAPINNDITEEYITGTDTKVDMPNVVTAVLASYRGYDTFGETTVILTAAIGVMLLLGGTRSRAEDDEEDASTPPRRPEEEE